MCLGQDPGRVLGLRRRWRRRIHPPRLCMVCPSKRTTHTSRPATTSQRYPSLVLRTQPRTQTLCHRWCPYLRQVTRTPGRLELAATRIQMATRATSSCRRRLRHSCILPPRGEPLLKPLSLPLPLPLLLRPVPKKFFVGVRDALADLADPMAPTRTPRSMDRVGWDRARLRIRRLTPLRTRHHTRHLTRGVHQGQGLVVPCLRTDSLTAPSLVACLVAP